MRSDERCVFCSGPRSGDSETCLTGLTRCRASHQWRPARAELAACKTLARFGSVAARPHITLVATGHADDECEPTLSNNKIPQAKQKRQGGGVCAVPISDEQFWRRVGLHRRAVFQPRSAKRGAPAPGAASRFDKAHSSAEPKQNDRRHRGRAPRGAPGVVRQRDKTPTTRNGAARLV